MLNVNKYLVINVYFVKILMVVVSVHHNQFEHLIKHQMYITVKIYHLFQIQHSAQQDGQHQTLVMMVLQLVKVSNVVMKRLIQMNIVQKDLLGVLVRVIIVMMDIFIKIEIIHVQLAVILMDVNHVQIGKDVHNVIQVLKNIGIITVVCQDVINYMIVQLMIFNTDWY